MAHLHLNELSLICDMWLNKITYLLTYLLYKVNWKDEMATNWEQWNGPNLHHSSSVFGIKLRENRLTI